MPYPPHPEGARLSGGRLPALAPADPFRLSLASAPSKELCEPGRRGRSARSPRGDSRSPRSTRHGIRRGILCALVYRMSMIAAAFLAIRRRRVSFSRLNRSTSASRTLICRSTLWSRLSKTSSILLITQSSLQLGVTFRHAVHQVDVSQVHQVAQRSREGSPSHALTSPYDVVHLVAHAHVLGWHQQQQQRQRYLRPPPRCRRRGIH